MVFALSSYFNELLAEASLKVLSYLLVSPDKNIFKKKLARRKPLSQIVIQRYTFSQKLPRNFHLPKDWNPGPNLMNF